jgi:hypothetical protein
MAHTVSFSINGQTQASLSLTETTNTRYKNLDD